MERDEAIATNRIQRGTPVAYRGQDTDRDILNPASRPAVLFHGHPGRITDPTLQHIQVDWVGLEDEPDHRKFDVPLADIVQRLTHARHRQTAAGLGFSVVIERSTSGQ